MNKADRERILSRKAERQKALLKRMKAKHRRSPATSITAPATAAAAAPPALDRDVPAPALSSIVEQFVDEYTAAQAEITRQRDRLVALRGGEDRLTEEDREALENIRDIVSARYERLLEV